MMNNHSTGLAAFGSQTTGCFPELTTSGGFTLCSLSRTAVQ